MTENAIRTFYTCKLKFQFNCFSTRNADKLIDLLERLGFTFGLSAGPFPLHISFGSLLFDTLQFGLCFRRFCFAFFWLCDRWTWSWGREVRVKVIDSIIGIILGANIIE